jgi:Uma2 family endonuclease
MIESGIFPDSSRVELLAGILVDKMTKNDPHDFTVGQLAERLRALLPAGWILREEKSVVLGKRDRPEPDIAVARGQHRDYSHRAPGPADLGMLIEVADTTYAKDRGLKWSRDARAGIPIYWIVNLPLQEVEVYSTVIGSGKTAGYRDSSRFRIGDELTVVIDGKEVGRIAVKEFLA